MDTAANQFFVLSTLASFCALSVGLNLTAWAAADKYNLWERYDTYKAAWMPERCMICVPLWFTLLYAAPYAAWSGLYWLALAPPIVAGITLKVAKK